MKKKKQKFIKLNEATASSSHKVMDVIGKLDYILAIIVPQRIKIGFISF